MTITARTKNGYQVEIQTRDHTWYSDEPLADGGADSAETPMEMMQGALAACKIITAHLYANRKGWQLEQVEISISHRKDKAGNVPESKQSDPNAPVDMFETQVHFIGNLDESQLARLAEIVDRCPVHRVLTNEVIIRKQVL